MEKSIPTPIAYLAEGLLRKPFLRWAKLTTAFVPVSQGHRFPASPPGAVYG
jgi:hypothetical protein